MPLSVCVAPAFLETGFSEALISLSLYPLKAKAKAPMDSSGSTARPEIHTLNNPHLTKSIMLHTQMHDQHLQLG